MNRYVSIAGIALLGLLTACTNAEYDNSKSGSSESSDQNRVNGSVTVRAGDPEGDASTVNGSISIEDNAKVSSAQTVNGGIDLGANATAVSVETVNGSITLMDGAHVTKDVETVNGKLTLRKSAGVEGNLSNVNGRIQLDSAQVGQKIQTVSGDIEVMGTSKVGGGILVQESGVGPIVFGKNDIPRIVIGPGAVVSGPLKFERKVELYVSDRATIGPVEGATPVRFTGDRPPG